jgi:hypothetical protein
LTYSQNGYAPLDFDRNELLQRRIIEARPTRLLRGIPMTPHPPRSTAQRFAVIGTALILMLGCTISIAEMPAQPASKLSPTDVVTLQLQALKHNDEPRADAGIATVFRFTSPGNRELTGPLPHFAKMIHQGYAAMLDYQTATLEPVIVKGDAALQGVDLIDSDGNAHRYVFILSRQQDAPYRGCWMTDSVLSDEAERPSQAI